MSTEVERKQLLAQWARVIEKAAGRGLFGGRPIGLRDCAIVNGPRAGALELDAGIDAGALLKSLQQNDCALARQFVPFDFQGEPGVFMAGRRLRLEAGWPAHLAESDIPLTALGRHPAGAGRWLLGRTERGSVLTCGLDDKTPHWLCSGSTGAGKTVTLVSAICQLAREKDNRLILIDCKHGASFRQFANLRGLVGPVCCDVYEAQAALSWTVGEMARRYSGGRDDSRRVVVIVDEVQEIAQDNLAAESLRRIVAQGRGCGVHCVLATQHPVIASLGGPTVGRNIVGRLALRVSDFDASRVAVGGATPRADRLLGRGDSYAIAPGATHRVQVAYFDGDVPTGARELDDWPEVDAAPAGDNWPGCEELAFALSAAVRGDGRKRLQDAAGAAGVHISDNNRANRLLKLARCVVSTLDDSGVSVCLKTDTHPTTAKTAVRHTKRVCAGMQTDRQLEENCNE